jgi:hypothetical protein
MRKSEFVRLVVCCTLVGILFAGCTSIDKQDEKSDKEDYVAPTKGLEKCKIFVEAGKKMIDSVYMGLSTGNYALYSRDFTDKNKKHFDKKIFDSAHEAVKEKLGVYHGIKFIGFWKKGDYDILLWKARFSETKDDILVQMYITKVDDTYKIAALKLI